MAEIQSIVVQSHDAAVDIIGSEPEKWRLTSRETADHSLPYIVAVALADGEVTMRQFAHERYSDPALLELVSRIRVERDAELSRAYPDAVGNIITITLRDGRRLTQRVDHPAGHARNSMSDAAVEAKFHALVDPLLGRERAGRVVRYLWDVDQVERIGDLPRLMLPP